MKRWLRITVWSLAILLIGGVIGWFWYFSRSLPKHAACIPRTSSAVLLFNTKELFMDAYYGGGKIQDSVKLDDYPLAKKLVMAVKDNGGLGIRLQSDLLVFAETDSAGQPSYIGLAGAVKDKEKLQSLAEKELPGMFAGNFVKAERSYFVIDSTQTFLSWNEKSVLVLQPVRQQKKEETLKHLTQLLSQREEESVLSDENFKTFCHEKFDLGLWINGKETARSEKHFPGMFTAGDEYVHALINFTSGEIETVLRRYGVKPGEASPSADPLLFDDANKVAAFFRFAFHPSDEQGALLSKGSIPWQWLNNKTGNATEWISCLDGNVSISLRDSVNYERSYITYEYDDNFNPVEVVRKEPVSMPGIQACFAVKDKTKMQELFTRYFSSDSNAVHLSGNIYRTGSDEPWYVELNGNHLFIRNTAKAGAASSATNTNESVIYPDRLYAQLPSSWKKEAYVELLLPGWAKKVAEIRSRPFLREGTTVSSYTTISFRNKSVNALVQLGEMHSKAGKLAQ